MHEGEKSQMFCEICYVDHPPSNFVTNPKCGHNFCKDSYKDFLTYEITRSGSRGYFIKCPQQGCTEGLSDEFIKWCVDEETFSKFKKFRTDKEVMTSDTKKYCPNPKCENVIVEAASKDATNVSCPTC